MTAPHQRPHQPPHHPSPSSRTGPIRTGVPRTDATRFPVAVDAALRDAGWWPGRLDMRQAEAWADALRAHTSPAGHQHAVFPAAVEAWAEFGGLRIAPGGPGRDIAPSALRVDPLYGLHAARTLGDLGRTLHREIAPLGAELPARAPDLDTGPDGPRDGGAPEDEAALLAIDTDGRVYAVDHTGDWYLGADIDAALGRLITGALPTRLTAP